MSHFDFDLNAARQLLGERWARHHAFCGQGLRIDLSRGRPSEEQLLLSEPMLEMAATIAPDGTDCRTYGGIQGIHAMRALWGELLGVDPARVVLSGSSSLSSIYDALARALLFGPLRASRPWFDAPARALLCPTPGYDRHFRIGETLGFRLIPVPMTEDGPDMDVVERLVLTPAVKGMFCVPKYANPSGVTYSPDTVARLARMHTAAPDFLLLWDNAYFCHDLYEEGEPLADIFAACEQAGHPSRPVMFASTSKITFPGSGIAAMVAGEDYLQHNLPFLSARAICTDQLSALRHYCFLKDADTVKSLMGSHAAILRPRFEALLDRLGAEFEGKHIADWTRPRGGYFITLRLLSASAKRVYQLAKEAGVFLTPAGATHPYGMDPEDAHLRLAPTSLSMDDLATACDVLINAIWLASLERYCDRG